MTVKNNQKKKITRPQRSRNRLVSRQGCGGGGRFSFLPVRHCFWSMCEVFRFSEPIGLYGFRRLRPHARAHSFIFQSVEIWRFWCAWRLLCLMRLTPSRCLMSLGFAYSCVCGVVLWELCWRQCVMIRECVWCVKCLILWRMCLVYLLFDVFWCAWWLIWCVWCHRFDDSCDLMLDVFDGCVWLFHMQVFGGVFLMYLTCLMSLIYSMYWMCLMFLFFLDIVLHQERKGECHGTSREMFSTTYCRINWSRRKTGNWFRNDKSINVGY